MNCRALGRHPPLHSGVTATAIGKRWLRCPVSVGDLGDVLRLQTVGEDTGELVKCGALNNAMEEKLSVNQCKMERIMLGITLRDRSATPGYANR